jgi:predicted metal-dependent hydrolase
VDARLREGIRLFNAGRYFDSHEALEEFYLRVAEKDKPFVEGLIQLAAALRMFHDFSETKGPARMARQAIIRLENYQPKYLGVRVQRLIEATESWAGDLEANPAVARERAPRIHLNRFIFF